MTMCGIHDACPANSRVLAGKSLNNRNAPTPINVAVIIMMDTPGGD